MKYKEVSFVLACVVIIFGGGFFLLPKVFKEFQDEEVIRVRVSLENKCSITDDAFVVLDAVSYTHLTLPTRRFV